MPATYASDGVIADLAGGNDIGGLNTGIGVGARNSGAPAIQSTTAADFKSIDIGSGTTASSASNLGNTLDQPLTNVAGSGYTNGTYRIQSTGGGQPDGCGEVEVVIAAGAISSSRVTRAGSAFASAPTFPIANAKNVLDGSGPGAGTGGSVTATVSLGNRVQMLGAVYGANKGTRYLTAVGAVANGAAVSGGYLNRSGRAMVAGESVWAVAP